MTGPAAAFLLPLGFSYLMDYRYGEYWHKLNLVGAVISGLLCMLFLHLAQAWKG